MVALVSVETVLLVVLVVLVAGLLRSHAEILRRLAEGAGSDPSTSVAEVPLPRQHARTEGELIAARISGRTPEGDAITLAFDHPGARPTLLAFLTSGCSTCVGFWESLGADHRLPAGVQTMIVTRGADRERPSRLRSLAPQGVPVVMSSEAWGDYGVPGTPYFVLVDGFVRGEGVAGTWHALASLVSDAIDDQREAERHDPGTERARRIEDTLTAAGIGPGHPSLHPGRQEPS